MASGVGSAFNTAFMVRHGVSVGNTLFGLLFVLVGLVCWPEHRTSGQYSLRHWTVTVSALKHCPEVLLCFLFAEETS